MHISTDGPQTFKHPFMKAILFLVPTLLATAALAADAPAPDFAVTGRGLHHNVWSKTVQEQSPGGRMYNRIHTYQEVASGLNYWSPEQQRFLPSTEEVEIVNGHAVARQGQLQVIWTANPNVAGAVDVQTSDGKRFQSHVLGLALTSAENGASFFFATLKDCQGEVAGSQVIYRQAFDGIDADIVYTYRKYGIEQDIVLNETLPDPTQPPWNLADASTVRLEIYTELINPPEPVVRATVLKSEINPARRAAMVEPDLIDQQLDFGATLIGPGKAFLAGAGEDDEANCGWRHHFGMGQKLYRFPAAKRRPPV